MTERPKLSPYALCEVADVADLLGYDAEQTTVRQRTIIRSINSVSKAIPRRAQREFVHTDAEKDQTRFVKIEPSEIIQGFARLRSGKIRVGDLQGLPSAVSIQSPDRDVVLDLDVTPGTGDIILLPDAPDPGFPYEYVYVKETSPNQPVTGWWLSVTADFGFPEVPGDITEIAICAAASLILNDVQALTQLAREAGRRVSVNAVIPSEYLDTIDEYRLWRVS